MQKRIDKGGPVLRAVIIATLMAAAWCLASECVHAEEEELNFQSDYQQEIQDEQVLILQGNVEVHFREMIIYADEVRLNDEKNEFFGVGDIHLVTPDRDIYADSIWFNYARDEFDMRNARGSMLAQGVGEPVWFEAERLTGDFTDFKMINGRVTTCTPNERREYHIEARSIKILPENKIIFRNGYTFILNIPVMWFPYWAYSLAETPWQIEVGKSSFDGVYVKTKYNYLAEELIIGTLLMDYYSRRGYRLTAQHEYVLPRHGKGKLNWSYLYGTYRDTISGDVTHANEYTFSISQPILFGSRFTGNVSFDANSRFNLNQGRSNDVNGAFTGNYNTANTRTSVSFTGRESSGATQSSNITSSFTHNRTIFENVTSSARINYTVNKPNNSGAANEEFTAGMEFRQSQEGWNWNAKVDTHWDPDGYTNTTDRNRPYTDRLPEINVTFQPNAFGARWNNLLGFSMQNLNLLGGLYYIGPEKKEINGFYGRMDTRLTRNIDAGPSHNIQSNIDYWQAISSTGDARYVYSTQVNWTWDIARKLKWKLDWNRSDNEGRIPFSGMDRPSTPGNRLTWNLNYQNGRLYTIRLSTSYVLREVYGTPPITLLSIKRLQPLSLSVNYTPSSKTRITLSTQYDLVNGDLGNISSSVTLTDNRSYTLNTNLNFQPPGTLTRFGTRAVFIIGDDWNFEVSAEMGSQSSGSIIRDIKFTHRLDCTFLSMEYGAQNDFWGFTWGVTAMPSAHLGWSTTEEAFGPGIFNQFQGTGSGFTGGGFGGY